MSRRGRGEGSITQRKDGRWQASYTGSDGNRYYLYARRREDVASKLHGVLSDKAAGIHVVGGEPKTVADYLPAWLDEYGSRRGLKPRTLQRYRGLIEHHLLPALGSVRLSRLTAHQIDDLYRRLRKSQSASSLAQLHIVLNAAMERAHRRQLIPANPLSEIERPRPSERNEMIVLSPDQSRSIIEATAGTELGTLYRMALLTGMRQGEMLALRWVDVDLDARWLDVNATLAYVDGSWHRGSPKSRAGIRKIKLSPVLADALRWHARAQRTRHRDVLHHDVMPETWIFTDEAGRPINGFHITERHFKPLLRSLGLPVIRFHDLRHAFVSLMLSLGVRIDLISRMLGHSSRASRLTSTPICSRTTKRRL
jgi:integrase